MFKNSLGLLCITPVVLCSYGGILSHFKYSHFRNYRYHFPRFLNFVFLNFEFDLLDSFTSYKTVSHGRADFVRR